MNEEAANSATPLEVSYDDLPYPSLSYGQTHPDRLAAMATLSGLESAPVDRCRYLDIGCAVGGNLLPMAEVLPGCEFVGIDNAAKQIETGRQYVAELGLNNVHLEHMDVLDVPESLGKFDYIVAHGFYSWVPAEVRDELFALIRRHLTPHGVAYVSYNTYPGWYLLRSIRDGMMLRTRHISDPRERAEAGKEIVRFLAKTLPEQEGGPFGTFLHSYMRSLGSKLAEGAEDGASLLLHDELASINDPVYFEQFVAHAAHFGLQYLSEVNLADVMPTRMDEERARELGKFARDPIEAEQWLDFIRFRTFRQTLLVHKEATVEKQLRPDVVGRFKLASLAGLEGDQVDLSPGVKASFRSADMALFTTDHPLTKAAFLEMMDRRPAAIPFADLARAAAARLDLTVSPELMPEINALAANALRALSYSPGLIEFHVFQVPMSVTPGPQPQTTRVMRWQAGNGMRVTNLRHERVAPDPLVRHLIQLLDGQHDRQQLVDYIMHLYAEDQFRLPEELLESSTPEEIIREQLEQALRLMGRSALLLAQNNDQ